MRTCKAPHCGNATSNNKYCSRSCAARVNNIRYPKRSEEAARRRGEPRKCWRCKNDYEPHLTSHGYCSTKCRHADIYDRIKPFLIANSPVSGGHVKSQLLLLGLLERKCAICGIKTWRGKPAPFVMDHINGNNRDHRLENLRIVCRNCDGQLETYCRKVSIP